MSGNMKITTEWKFLIIILSAYFLLFFFSNNIFIESFNFFTNITLKMLPAFLLVFVFMFVTNLFVTKDLIKRIFQKGVHGWLFAIIGGILSMGPVYAWYPLLQEMKEKGLNNGFIACFIYNKAIKLPLIPVMIFYFGIEYVLVLSLIIVFFSIIQGLIMDKIMKIF